MTAADILHPQHETLSGVPGAFERFDALVTDLPLAWDSYPTETSNALMSALALFAAREPNQPTPGDASSASVSTGDQDAPPTMPRTLTLLGLPHAGKDVVADAAQAKYAHVARFATSDILLNEVNRDFLSHHGYRITVQTKSGEAERLLLQSWGFGRRLEDPRYLADRTAVLVQDFFATNADRVIVSGVRIPRLPDGTPDLTETDALRASGSALWLVQRPGNPYAATNPVEDGLLLVPDDYFDKVVYNAVEGDLAAFHRNVSAAIAGVEQPHAPAY